MAQSPVLHAHPVFGYSDGARYHITAFQVGRRAEPRDQPELMRTMAERAGSTPVEVAASHAVFLSQPEAVAGLIEEAAKALGK